MTGRTLALLLFVVAGGAGVGCTPAAESAVVETPDPARDHASSDAETASSPDDPIARLLDHTPVPEAEEEEILEALRDAVQEARDEESVAAALRADALLARLPTLEDWRPLLRAELLTLAGDTAGVREAVAAIDPATGFVARWGWGFEVDALAAAGDSARAFRTARRVADVAPTPDEAAGPRLRSAELALALGDTTAARSALRAALAAGPDHPAARGAARTLDRIEERSGGSGLGAEDRFALGRALLAAEVWDRAHHHLAPFLEGAGREAGTGPTGAGPGPGGSAGGDARLDVSSELRLGLGRGLVELRRLSEARRLLAPLTHADVPTDAAAPALFWTARAQLAAGERSGAADSFLELARRAPGHPYAEEGLLLLLEDAERRGATAEVARAREVLLRTGVRSSAAELVAVRHGAGRYLSGDFASAARTFEDYHEGARRTASRQQAAYWAALAHERLGETTAARVRLERSWEEDPLSYYGVFAGERLGLPVLPEGIDPGPPPVPGLERELLNAITRLRVHQIVPTAGSFNHELERLQEHFFRRGDGAYDFAERLIVSGFPIQGVVLGRQIRQREGEWNVRLLRIVYPLPYRDAVVREARARGLDPFFVAGLIRQESLFHPTIESVAGAVGLMQLLPSTAQEVARSQGLRYSRAQLGDPDYNLRLGTQYLATMLRRYDGRAEDALSAYNAGPGRINQWRQRAEYRDRDVFVEFIPFQETRHYVKVVQQNTRIYTALYGCPEFTPCLGDSYAVARARSPFAGGVPSSSLAR